MYNLVLLADFGLFFCILAASVVMIYMILSQDEDEVTKPEQLEIS